MKRIYLIFLCLLFSACAVTQKHPIDIFERAEDAGVKITALGEHADFVDDGDLYVIVDSSANTTKKLKPHWQTAYDIQARATFSSDVEDNDGTPPPNIVLQDGGKIITNRGYTTNPIVYRLPECRADPSGDYEVGDGWWVIFYTINPYGIRVDPDGDDTIEDFASGTPENGEYITLDGVVGSIVKCICQNGPDPNTHGGADSYNFYTMGYVGVVTSQD